MAPDARWDAPEEFDHYVEARHAALLRFAYFLSGDPHSAADLVQDALERAGLAWRRIRRRDHPEAYIRRSILNAYLSRTRRRSREVLVASPPEVADYDREPRDETLWHLLGTLPRQQRAILVLRFYEDLTEAEIARVLGCAVGTVKSNSSRALAKLRAALPTRTASANQVDTTDGGEP